MGFCGGYANGFFVCWGQRFFDFQRQNVKANLMAFTGKKGRVFFVLFLVRQKEKQSLFSLQKEFFSV